MQKSGRHYQGKKCMKYRALGAAGEVTLVLVTPVVVAAVETLAQGLAATSEEVLMAMAVVVDMVTVTMDTVVVVVVVKEVETLVADKVMVVDEVDMVVVVAALAMEIKVVAMAVDMTTMVEETMVLEVEVEVEAAAVDMEEGEIATNFQSRPSG
ncbi:unnamed protein product [Ranitomeya imitator]|uniref:Uncharacterized protein n=1 Tax=Ranitomeya imitator TaxID=111125 RepID=A0ABN9LLY1_9NEOB|nr:unnamed protein product [Ranitomeya imitator]